MSHGATIHGLMRYLPECGFKVYRGIIRHGVTEHGIMQTPPPVYGFKAFHGATDRGAQGGWRHGIIPDGAIHHGVIGARAGGAQEAGAQGGWQEKMVERLLKLAK